MKFTVIGHACLYIEHQKVRLLIDPWIKGSCYWRSWWNYPKVDEKLINYLNPTHIYITHLHWDHYHGPSLRLFENINPKILIAKHFNKRMKSDFEKDFKFDNIKELVHGKRYKLGSDFVITSYQFNPFIIDSSLVIEAANTTLLNSNDSKVFGLSLKQIINNHKQIDFIFRSHSSASPIPHCIDGKSPEYTDRSPKDYADDFIAFAKATKAKYAIPFASSHIYLHKLTKKYNKYYSNPDFVKTIFESKIKTEQSCVLMPSGSSWSKKLGFNIKDHDYTKLKKDIENYTHDNKQKLETLYLKENKNSLNKKAFHNYFSVFLKSIRFPFNLDFRVGFLINEIKNKKLFLCIIDGKSKKTMVEEIYNFEEIYGYNLSFVISTPVYVFNDCNLKKMHNTFTPSKLLEVFLINKKSEKQLNSYLSLVDFYENDGLPITKLVSIRNIPIIFRRWREFIDMIIYIYKIKFKKQKIYSLYSNLN